MFASPLTRSTHQGLHQTLQTHPCGTSVQCADTECVATMRAILQETFDVLELDPFYAALVPMHRGDYIQSVLFEAKGSVASYGGHFPSSHQHYVAKQLVDTRALNGFVVRKARELNADAPLNECAPCAWLPAAIVRCACLHGRVQVWTQALPACCVRACFNPADVSACVLPTMHHGKHRTQVHHAAGGCDLECHRPRHFPRRVGPPRAARRREAPHRGPRHGHVRLGPRVRARPWPPRQDAPRAVRRVVWPRDREQPRADADAPRRPQRRAARGDERDRGRAARRRVRLPARRRLRAAHALAALHRARRERPALPARAHAGAPPGRALRVAASLGGVARPTWIRPYVRLQYSTCPNPSPHLHAPW
jgi:Ketopantoate reductase PanE/ApbA C terminal